MVFSFSVNLFRQFEMENENLHKQLEIERTVRYNLEKRLKDFEEVKSDTNLHNAILCMSDGFLLHDLDGNIKTANQQLNKIYFNKSRPDVVSDELLCIMKHDAYPGKHNKLVDSSFEIVLSSGRTIIVKAHRTTDQHIVSTHQDITHRRAYEVEQLRLLKELYSSQKLEAIGRMTGVIAHDFNNIIAAILGYAGFLEDDLEMNSELKTYARRITESAQKGSQIISSILDFSRKNDTPYTPIDINNLIREVCNIVEPTLSNEVTIDTHFTNGNTLVAANQAQMTQLLMNLITNSRDAYLEEPSEENTIRISTEMVMNYDLSDKSTEYLPRYFKNTAFHSTKKGITKFSIPCLKLTISDQATGMNAKTMEQLFEPFFSTKHKKQGTGLGLFGVSGIIAEHGGGLKIYSAEDIGTHCVIILPLEAESLTATKSLKRPIKVPTHGNVMVIDDEPTVGLMLAELLTRNGIPAVYYENPKSAIDALRSDKTIWRAIICDQMMPSMNGTDVFEQIRTIKNDILFILCSGNSHKIDQEYLLSNGAMFLPKPIDKNHLLAIVD